MAQYTQEEIGKLFETLPAELKEALLAEETANSINDICQRNEIKEKSIPQVAHLIGNVLMGILPPDDFPTTLATELGIDSTRAKRITQEVNRFILYSVKGSLSGLYKGVKFVPGGRIEKPEVGEIEELEELGEIEGAGETEDVTKEKPGKRKPSAERKKKGGADVYRETVK